MTPKPEVTEAELGAAEADAREATATLMRVFAIKTEETTETDMREAERASRTVQKFERLHRRAVREHGQRRGDC